MVNIGIRKVDEALVEKHPGLQQYAACQYNKHVLNSESTTEKDKVSAPVEPSNIYCCFLSVQLHKKGEIPDSNPPKDELQTPAIPKVTKYGDAME
ncbi:hypothetical protein HF521_013370 [Silurus meridionalis]|uniref:Uncharacterized protein n=1 Tax=Silurus meridionalis TaxID=175797 RepID=A0A8T0AB57_SILME|nr:hypothetical protein HF521_013370 [Silurus meridionalis]